MNKIGLFLLLLMASCTSYKAEWDPPQTLTGASGANGSNGKDGVGISIENVVIENIDRDLNAWDTHNIELSYDGKMSLPSTIYVDALSQNENGGWLDVYIGDQTYCYQGKVGKKQYEYKYKKVLNHSDGCDLNNEKDGNSVGLLVKFNEGDEFGVVPRAPKLSGVVFDFNQIVGYIKN